MFYNQLVEEILSHYRNNLDDNIDFYRFPDGIKNSLSRSIKLKILALLPEFIIKRYYRLYLFSKLILSPLYFCMKELEEFYHNLEDNISKELLIKLIASDLLIRFLEANELRHFCRRRKMS